MILTPSETIERLKEIIQSKPPQVEGTSLKSFFIFCQMQSICFNESTGYFHIGGPAGSILGRFDKERLRFVANIPVGSKKSTVILTQISYLMFHGWPKIDKQLLHVVCWDHDPTNLCRDNLYSTDDYARKVLEMVESKRNNKEKEEVEDD